MSAPVPRQVQIGPCESWADAARRAAELIANDIEFTEHPPVDGRAVVELTEGHIFGRHYANITWMAAS